MWLANLCIWLLFRFKLITHKRINQYIIIIIIIIIMIIIIIRYKGCIN